MSRLLGLRELFTAVFTSLLNRMELIGVFQAGMPLSGEESSGVTPSMESANAVMETKAISATNTLRSAGDGGCLIDSNFYKSGFVG